MIRILIVAGIRLYREGLEQILGREERLLVRGIAADADAALRLVREWTGAVDVVLVDMTMPNSLTLARRLATEAPAIRVVALGVPDDDRDVIVCAEAGVAGYVPREASLADLVATLESVARGELLCSPRTAAALLRRVKALATEPEHAVATLTPREREIVRLLEMDLSNKEIGRRLGIELATVKNHVHNILEKLRVHRRGQAARRAIHPPPGSVDHRRRFTPTDSI